MKILRFIGYMVVRPKIQVPLLLHHLREIEFRLKLTVHYYLNEVEQENLKQK
jgi:hypothetical protein